MAEASVGPRAVRDGHATAVVARRAEAPELVGLQVSPVGHEPVDAAEPALAKVVGRARADGLPVVVPGADVFEEAAERAGPRSVAGSTPRASRPGASKAAACRPRRARRAIPPCCTARAGSAPGEAFASARPPRYRSTRSSPTPPDSSRSRACASGREPRRRPRRAAARRTGHPSSRPAGEISATLVVPAARLAADVAARWRSARHCGAAERLLCSTTRRSQRTSSSVQSLRSGCGWTGVRSRWMCALTSPGRTATLPRSRSAGPRRLGSTPTMAPSLTTSRPSSIGGPSTGMR